MDREKVADWSQAIISPGSRNLNYSARKRKVRALTAYLQDMFADRRIAPRDDLVSDLVQVKVEGDRLSEAELSSMIALLLVTGHETTVNLIGNGTLALLQNREQLSAAVPKIQLSGVLPSKKFYASMDLLKPPPLGGRAMTWNSGDRLMKTRRYGTDHLASANRDLKICRTDPINPRSRGQSSSRLWIRHPLLSRSTACPLRRDNSLVDAFPPVSRFTLKIPSKRSRLAIRGVVSGITLPAPFLG